MKIRKEYEVLKKHIAMFEIDFANNRLIAKENAPDELKNAIEVINRDNEIEDAKYLMLLDDCR